MLPVGICLKNIFRIRCTGATNENVKLHLTDLWVHVPGVLVNVSNHIIPSLDKLSLKTYHDNHTSYLILTSFLSPRKKVKHTFVAERY